MDLLETWASGLGPRAVGSLTQASLNFLSPTCPPGGPDRRLLPLLGSGSSVVGEYRARRVASVGVEHPEWPEGVVPVLTWGCAMYAGVDCLSEDGQVLLFEPNPYSGGSWEQCWFLYSASLAAWLETWLVGTGWFEEDVFDRDDLVEPQPWAQAVVSCPPVYSETPTLRPVGAGALIPGMLTAPFDGLASGGRPTHWRRVW